MLLSLFIIVVIIDMYFGLFRFVVTVGPNDFTSDMPFGVEGPADNEYAEVAQNSVAAVHSK